MLCVCSFVYLLIDGNWVLCVETEDVCNGMRLSKSNQNPIFFERPYLLFFAANAMPRCRRIIESLAERGKMVFEGGLDLVSE